mgnify:CR=1 FL=1|jgi:mRNA interferase RelE/StbE
MTNAQAFVSQRNPKDSRVSLQDVGEYKIGRIADFQRISLAIITICKVQIHKQASKKLKALNAKERFRITDKIMELSYDPDSKTLDAKKLSGMEYWRLRVGDWRVIYDRDDVVKIIKIERIKSRGDIYK